MKHLILTQGFPLYLSKWPCVLPLSPLHPEAVLCPLGQIPLPPFPWSLFPFSLILYLLCLSILCPLPLWGKHISLVLRTWSWGPELILSLIPFTSQSLYCK